MDALSEGYAQTTEALKKGDAQAALDAYRTKFVVTYKELYSEAAETYPLRFEKMDTWCIWTKDVYVKTVQLEQALTALPAKDSAEAKTALDNLEALRAAFYTLHEKSQTLSTCDYVYALRTECRKDAPDVAALKKIQEDLSKATPARKAKKQSDEYEKARAAWNTVATPVLEKGEVSKESLKSLRKAGETFYEAFGMQLE
jgi:hypothetical protein